jgi:serine/threonine protein kinase
LGQGTFAQVFHCVHVQTGQRVAVKIVKNKPAYTRQAAVEIDVFRALTKKPAPGTATTSGDPKSKAEHDASDSNHAESDDHGTKWDYMVDMVCYFMYRGHLCLVFELLGLNLYEVLKKRQFRGLPLTVVRTLLRQAVLGTKELAQKSIVHCDLKPENILLVSEDDVDSVVSAGESKRLSSSLRSNASYERRNAGKEPPTSTATINSCDHSGNSTSTSNTDNTRKKKGEGNQTVDTEIFSSGPPTSITSSIKTADWQPEQNPPAGALCHSPTHSDGPRTTVTHGISLAEERIKLIDFGSACFEGQTAHTYIQSRFYRSPEVLLGLTYDSAIDMWSLGCVAAELFLGLPILPGVHEHDQLGRISEMIGDLPDWMLDQGTKSQKYFVKFVPAPTPPVVIDSNGAHRTSPPCRPLPQWRIKTQHEYVASLSQNEINRKGGLAKLQKQPGNRYFKRKRLADIIEHKGQSGLQEDKEQLQLFIHFLYGKEIMCYACGIYHLLKCEYLNFCRCPKYRYRNIGS